MLSKGHLDPQSSDRLHSAWTSPLASPTLCAPCRGVYLCVTHRLVYSVSKTRLAASHMCDSSSSETTSDPRERATYNRTGSSRRLASPDQEKEADRDCACSLQMAQGMGSSSTLTVPDSLTDHYFAPHWGASFKGTGSPTNQNVWAPSAAPQNSSAVFYMSRPNE